MKIFIVFLLIVVPLLSIGQTSIKGSVGDSLTNKKMDGAIVMLLKQNSFLDKYARSDENGQFIIKDVQVGIYKLVISHENYIDFVDALSIQKKGDVVIGNVKMLPIEHLLTDVVVKSKKGRAVEVHGDTTIFSADSFNVNVHATVEDLFKKLPGLQIDRFGRITAQGEKVQRVLVDGEEFFGDDPVLVTRNLTADMVDKVQLYDRASDESMFTGIDDGQKKKTINLQLKKDKKNSTFGRLSGGMGVKNYYATNGMLNMFNEKQKVAVYGLAGNDGVLGINEEDPKGGTTSYDGVGQPTVVSSGFHFNNAWYKDQQKFNGDYKYSFGGIKKDDNYLTKNILPDQIITTTSHENSDNKTYTNILAAEYERIKKDKSNLKISIDGGYSQFNKTANLQQSSLNDNNVLLNSSESINSSIRKNKRFNGSAFWQKKFKTGTTLSIGYEYKLNQEKLKGTLNSLSVFHSVSLPSADSTDIIDQAKRNNVENNNSKITSTYTNPIGTFSHLIINYSAIINNSSSRKESFNKGGNMEYNSLDSQYSNNYKYNSFGQLLGAYYNYAKGKLFINAGSNLGTMNYHQNNLYSGDILNRNFTLYNPEAKIRYNFSSQHRISLIYNGNTVQPTNDQLQPFADNSDPLNIRIGNNLLRPAHNNSFNLIYANFKPSTERTVLINALYSFMSNPIVEGITTDKNGKNTFQFINITSGHFSTFHSYVIYSKMLPKINWRINSSIDFNRSNFFNFNNGLKNQSNSSIYSATLGLSKSEEKVFDFHIFGELLYNILETSSHYANNDKYWTYKISPELDLYLGRFQLHNDLENSYQEKTIGFLGYRTCIWNSWVGMRLLKSQNFLLKVAAHDILNQNIGIKRSINNNFISEERYNTIRRNFMVSVNWNFKKTKTKN